MKKYNQNDLVIDQDPVSAGDIIMPDVLEQIIADANRYHYLKTADHGCLHWYGQVDGWIDADSAEDWDEMIDLSLGDEK